MQKACLLTEMKLRGYIQFIIKSTTLYKNIVISYFFMDCCNCVILKCIHLNNITGIFN